MSNVFAHLNSCDVQPGVADERAAEPSASTARRRVLGRLGEYASIIVGPLNLRPTAATLLAEDGERVEVRISTAGSHVVLVIALEGDLAAEVFFLRTLAAAHLPIARLIAHDLSCTSVQFTYAVESYVSGVPLERLEDGPLMRVAARQIGYTLRRAHQFDAPGFGRPTPSGRWPSQTWADTLDGWLARRDVCTLAEQALGQAGIAALRAATIDHLALAWERPRLIHGAVEPARAIVTVGDSVQLEALSRPGEIVGGDPLFDLAHGLLPRHPAAFRQGLIEGYTARGPLDRDAEQRLRRLGLLIRVADTICHAEEQALARLPNEVAAELAELGG